MTEPSSPRSAGHRGGAAPRWIWTVAVAVVAVLGFVGWLRIGVAPLDAAYQTIQLFTLDYPSDVPPTPVLDVARFGAVATTATALLAVARSYLRAQAARREMARLVDHTVVIGAGSVGAGILEALRRQDPDEALLAVDVDHRALERVAHLGAHVLDGDGRRAATLRTAGVDRAGRVIVALGDWALTAAASDQVARIADQRALALAHVGDLRLCHVVRRRFLLDRSGSTDVFNLQENVAKALLHPFDDRLAGAPVGPTRIVVLGGARIAEALLVQASLAWLASPRPFPLELEVVDTGEDPTLSIAARWPELAPVLDEVRHVDASPSTYVSSAPIDLTTRYVVDLPSGGIGHAVGTALTERDPDVDCVVLSRADQEHRPGRQRDTSPAALAWDRGVLDTDSLWQLARSLHEVYRQRAIAGSSAHAGSWASLAPHIREDNRAAVAFMLDELQEHGCTVTRARSLDPAVRPPDLAAVIGRERAEALAAAEHERWRRSRASSPEPPGRFATSWHDLDPAARQASLETVNRWPLVLLRVGYEITGRRESHVDRLLRRGGTYHRRGRVAAHRATEPVTWQTSSGEELTAAAGDWIVEQDGRRWSVAPDAFRQAYRRADGGGYTRRGRVRAVRLAEPVELTTDEGVVTGHPGDWLVENELAHVWPVPDDHFRANYRPALRTGPPPGDASS